MKTLVTGGGGFLGKALVRALLDRGETVRNFSRSHYQELEDWGVELHQGDLADFEAVSKAVEGMDIVFHCAALPGVVGPYERYHRTNVTGTENVIKACQQHGVAKLVFTSSPSVVADGKRDIEGEDESAPYGKTFKAHYPKTKALAEQLVLAANSPALATVAIRPPLIWGPGDHHILPRLADRARKGKLKRIGAENKLVDAIYIDNAVLAHLLAADKLSQDSVIAGKAYFVSQGKPIPIWDIVNSLLEAANAPRVDKKVPYAIAYAGAWCMENAFRMLGREDEPPLTRFVVQNLTTARWFKIDAAKRDLGYEPSVTMEEGLERLRQDFAKSASK